MFGLAPARVGLYVSVESVCEWNRKIEREKKLIKHY